MFVYCVLILLIVSIYVLLNIISKRLCLSTKKKEKTFLIIVWLLLSYVAGMRAYSVGSDSITYAYYFRIGNAGHFELGYSLLCNFLGMFTENATVLFWTCALITNGLILLVIYRQSSYVLLSVYTYIGMFYYFNSFNAMRQYMAIAFVFFAYDYLRRNKTFMFFLWIIVAMLFHRMALVIGLFLFFLIHYKKDKTNNNILKYEVIIILGAAIWFLWEKIILLFVKIFPEYSFYLEDGSHYLNVSGGIQDVIVYALLFVAVLLFAKNSNSNAINMIMCVVMMLSVISLKLAIAVRILWYFDIYTILAIPNVVMSGKDRQQRLFLFMILIIAITLLMIYNLHIGKQRVDNYQFVFQS